MKHFHYFEDEGKYMSKVLSNYEEPWVSWTEDKGVDYNTTIDYSSIPLTVLPLGSGTMSTPLSGDVLYYSKNGDSWSTFNYGDTISVNGGDVVQLKAVKSDYSANGGLLNCSAYFDVMGNIMSLVYGDDFKKDNYNDFSGTFTYLFRNKKVKSAENLILPNLYNVPTNCYGYMFADSTLVTSPLIIPGRNVSQRGCNSMFQGCTSLTTVPELPAEYIGTYGYQAMFYGCSKITTAPVLPALSLTNYCYDYMFNRCSKLNYVKAMFKSALSHYINKWLYGVSATGTFVKNAEATWNDTDVVPSGWTVETATE